MKIKYIMYKVQD